MLSVVECGYRGLIVLAAVSMYCPHAVGQSGTADTGGSAAIVETILERARETDSSAVIVVRDGDTIVEEHFDQPDEPIEAMSATKSVVALAFGRLLADGRLKSLETPVHDFYPEWNQGRKKDVTIRDLLTQRSGLQTERLTTEIYRSPDFVQLALAAELADDPGTTWHYNNKATNLLAGLVERISGTRMDRLIGEEIFEPLGITDWSWSLDNAGNPHAMSGLQIRPADLAKIGQLMLNGGVWEGERILPKSFVDEAVSDQITPPPTDPQAIPIANGDNGPWFFAGNPRGYGPHYGLLWWINWESEVAVTARLLEEWRRTGAPDEFIEKMTTLKGLTGDELSSKFSDTIGEFEWFAATVEAGRPDWDTLAWHNHGYSAEGYLGQYLVVVPEADLVAVRMRRAPTGEYDESRIDHFKDFKALIWRLGEHENTD